MGDGLPVSDADRNRAAVLLRDHFVAGRLTPEELDDRLTAALGARTFGDLRRALAGLPERAPALQQASPLERGYRRLLAFYPARHRRAHEEEMLAVLMTAAPEGKRRPGLVEAADLILGALRVRCQPSRGGMAGPAWRGVLALLGAGAVPGLLAGIAFAAVNPPLLTSDALVLIPRSPFLATQLVIARSDPVLERAAQAIRPGMSLQALQSQVQVSSPTDRVMLISAQGTTAAQAERAASAVAHSYIAYVSGKNAPGGKMQALLLEAAAIVPGTSLLADLLDTGGLGALCGALIGAIGAVALSRRTRHFRMT